MSEDTELLRCCAPDHSEWQIGLNSRAAGHRTTLTTTATATKAITMTTLQKTLIAATVLAAVGTGIYEARRASTLRSQVQTLQQQKAEQLQQLQRERDEATAKLVLLQNEIGRFNHNNAELLRLRAEVTRMRKEVSANLTGKKKPTSQDGPFTEQTSINASPVETYSATARAVVPWNQALITGGWRTPSDKMVYVLAVPKRGEDPAVVMIETRVMEVSVEAATMLGLDQSNTSDKETKLSAVLTTELYETIVKAANDTNAVAIIDSPRVTILTGRQAQIQSKSDKETRAGEKYSVGPTLTLMPTISDDGQSVDLGMIANVKYPSPAASQ